MATKISSNISCQAWRFCHDQIQGDLPGKMRLLLAWLGTYCVPSARAMDGKAVPLAYTALPSVQSIASCFAKSTADEYRSIPT